MKIGDKVVCVTDKIKNGETCFNPGVFKLTGIIPAVGSTYVINGFHIDGHGVLGLKLIGCQIIHIPSGLETGWNSRFFRLLDEMKESASKSKTQEQSA